MSRNEISFKFVAGLGFKFAGLVHNLAVGTPVTPDLWGTISKADPNQIDLWCDGGTTAI